MKGFGRSYLAGWEKGCDGHGNNGLGEHETVNDPCIDRQQHGDDPENRDHHASPHRRPHNGTGQRNLRFAGQQKTTAAGGRPGHLALAVACQQKHLRAAPSMTALGSARCPRHCQREICQRSGRVGGGHHTLPRRQQRGRQMAQINAQVLLANCKRAWNRLRKPVRRRRQQASVEWHKSTVPLRLTGSAEWPRAPACSGGATCGQGRRACCCKNPLALWPRVRPRPPRSRGRALSPAPAMVHAAAASAARLSRPWSGGAGTTRGTAMTCAQPKTVLTNFRLRDRRRDVGGRGGGNPFRSPGRAWRGIEPRAHLRADAQRNHQQRERRREKNRHE